jgi:uncharacterized damage-inducible protein DinB
MGIGEHMADELRLEGRTTRKVLERLPDDKFDWQPHEKSMTLGHLASHLVNNLGWADLIIGSDGIDFEAMDFTPSEYHSSAECVAAFDKALEATASLLASTDDPALFEKWTARAGDRIFFSEKKIGVLRGFVMNHNIHHRSQLAMYLRLNDIPVPQIYGPTADEPEM